MGQYLIPWNSYMLLLQYYSHKRFYRLYLFKLTISWHAQCQTFLQSTILASISIHSVYHALFISWTLIIHRARLTATEKSFAALTCNHPIMYTWWLIPTYFARDHLNLCWKVWEKRNCYCMFCSDTDYGHTKLSR